MTELVRRSRLALKPPALVVPALAMLAAVLAGCGSDVPSNAVATVQDVTIQKSQFDHWLNAAARGQQPPTPGARPAVPDPPEFRQCVATKQGQLPRGARAPDAAALRNQCRKEYDDLKQQVMQFLISATWIQKEAEERDIQASEQEVRKQFEDQKRQSFPKDSDYRSFLASSGQTEQDLLYRVRLDVLSNQIREKVIADRVNDQALRAEYDKNRQRFAQPEQRDLEVILAKGEARARQARKAARRDFGRAAKRFSTDDATKRTGGKLPGYQRGQLDKAFDDAVFKAKQGELVGPVKTQFGSAVFRVTKVTPPAQGSFEQAKQQLRGQLEQKALDDFVTDFRKRYKDQTTCGKDFVVEDCKNAPPPPKAAPPQPGGGPPPPQGPPPEGAPPGGQGPPPGGGSR